MPRRFTVLACTGAALYAPSFGTAPVAAAPSRPAARTVVIGHSVKGRPIVAHRLGEPGSRRKAIVVGNIHGSEPEGVRVTRAIRRMGAAATGIDLWVIDTVNPDGIRAHRRQNARGVDLNRNFGADWRFTGPPGSRYYAGRRAFSEPEARAVRNLVKRLRPAVTIWYHQPLGFVIPPRGGGDLAIARHYARLASNAVRTPAGVRYTGTATTWQNRTVPGSTAFVVELPAHRAPQARIDRHARAALAIAGPRLKVHPRYGVFKAAARNLEPAIVQKPIRFGSRRRAEMARYSRRHYGHRTWRLTNPHVIVEHYTATRDFGSAFRTFAHDVRDPELHELPGVCTHFIVDTNGTIYQLVPLKIRCRHTVGLNYTAIGIEHVGMSDRQVMRNRRQLRASIALTRWLRCSRNIRVRNVIGHNESLRSPYHHERVRRLRHQTHSDMRRATMIKYRARIRSAGC